jgi:Isochorismatase family
MHHEDPYYFFLMDVQCASERFSTVSTSMLVCKLSLYYFVAVIFGSASAFVGPAGRNLHHVKLRREPSSSLFAISNNKLDPRETAVVFIEYQNEFTTPGGKLNDAVKDVMAATNMLSNSRRVLEAARNAGCTIIHCPISFEPVRAFLLAH